MRVACLVVLCAAALATTLASTPRPDRFLNALHNARDSYTRAVHKASSEKAVIALANRLGSVGYGKEVAAKMARAATMKVARKVQKDETYVPHQLDCGSVDADMQTCCTSINEFFDNPDNTAEFCALDEEEDSGFCMDLDTVLTNNCDNGFDDLMELFLDDTLETTSLETVTEGSDNVDCGLLGCCTDEYVDNITNIMDTISNTDGEDVADDLGDADTNTTGLQSTSEEDVTLCGYDFDSAVAQYIEVRVLGLLDSLADACEINQACCDAYQRLVEEQNNVEGYDELCLPSEMPPSDDTLYQVCVEFETVSNECGISNLAGLEDLFSGEEAMEKRWAKQDVACEDPATPCGVNILEDILGGLVDDVSDEAGEGADEYDVGDLPDLDAFSGIVDFFSGPDLEDAISGWDDCEADVSVVCCGALKNFFGTMALMTVVDDDGADEVCVPTGAPEGEMQADMCEAFEGLLAGELCSMEDIMDTFDDERAPSAGSGVSSCETSATPCGMDLYALLDVSLDCTGLTDTCCEMATIYYDAAREMDLTDCLEADYSTGTPCAEMNSMLLYCANEIDAVANALATSGQKPLTNCENEPVICGRDGDLECISNETCAMQDIVTAVVPNAYTTVGSVTVCVSRYSDNTCGTSATGATQICQTYAGVTCEELPTSLHASQVSALTCSDGAVEFGSCCAHATLNDYAKATCSRAAGLVMTPLLALLAAWVALFA